jgi:hypothetical protein
LPADGGYQIALPLIHYEVEREIIDQRVRDGYANATANWVSENPWRALFCGYQNTTSADRAIEECALPHGTMHVPRTELVAQLERVIEVRRDLDAAIAKAMQELTIRGEREHTAQPKPDDKGWFHLESQWRQSVYTARRRCACLLGFRGQINNRTSRQSHRGSDDTGGMPR